MKKQKLTDSVSLQELQEMRENGMTNRQIAEALDVGYSTICNYLGRQPKGLRAAQGTYTSPKDAVAVAEKPNVLERISCIEEYAGATCQYTVRRDMGVVTITPARNDCIQFDKQGLERYITELLDILSML